MLVLLPLRFHGTALQALCRHGQVLVGRPGVTVMMMRIVALEVPGAEVPSIGVSSPDQRRGQISTGHTGIAN